MSLFLDIEKSFSSFRLSVKMEVGDEPMALLGGSGCGKSLTLRCIAGIEKPDRGCILIDGEVVFDSDKRINMPPQKRRVGYLFQNYALFPTMTVRDNIACVVKLAKGRRCELLVDDIIKKFHLDDVRDLYPRQISGGQQQRVALARILASGPKILMLDEPFSALDSHLRWSMEQEISSVLAEFKGTTVFVSHNQDEVYRLCKRVALMNNGKIETAGTKEDIFDTPKTLAAAMMTGCKNISKAKKIDDCRVKALDWGVSLRTNCPVPDKVKYVAVHAQHFKTAADGRDEDNIFPCQIHRIIDEPFERIVVFSFGDGGHTLHFKISKDACAGWDRNNIFVPGEKIMCLE